MSSIVSVNMNLIRSDDRQKNCAVYQKHKRSNRRVLTDTSAYLMVLQHNSTHILQGENMELVFGGENVYRPL